MSDGMLFDVPKNKTRLELLKEQHGITTARRCEYEVGEGVEGWAAWLTDGHNGPEFGDTEADAILDLCRKNNIQVTL